MALLGKIFGNQNVVDKGIDGIEKILYTNEEKAENKIELLKAYEPFKLAQRLIALLVTGVYLFVLLLCVVMTCISCWSDKAMELAKELASWNNELLSMPFILIMSFYFAGGAAEGVINKFRKQQKK
ncbi:MAG: hypothetical protein ACK5LV_11215 [Lachnospirales bacterium]